ncbi:MAG: NAD(P)-binding domain-containing protein [Gemmatimonadota bacterium]|nr:NAD(P)-binding domain-containing protein [Gemmatimonadota bacterium]
MTAEAAAHLPVVIVGAGPCGLAAGVALQDAGIPAVLFDKGCIVQSLANYPVNLTMFSTPEKLVIGGVPFTPAGFRPTRAETLAYYREVARRHALHVRQYERVVSVERRNGAFVVTTERVSAGPAGGAGLRGPAEERRQRAQSEARAVVIATGYFDYPNMLGVPGEDLPHVSHRFAEGHTGFGRDVLVVGGGNSAVECAIELARCGARVTVVHYEPGFVSHVIKPWVLPDFERFVADGAIRLRWSTRVRAIEPGRAMLMPVAPVAPAAPGAAPASADPAALDASGAEAVPADLVYVMTGYTPRPGLLGDLGVPFDPGTGVPAHDPATMETTVPGVYVAGVLTAGKKANGVFIENGRGHGALIAAAIPKAAAP